VSAASIRDSIVAMKAVAGMANPLLEASLVRTGTRLASAIAAPSWILSGGNCFFDFERVEQTGSGPSAASEPYPLRQPGKNAQQGIQDRFLAAVQAEELGEKNRAISLYEEILQIDPAYSPAYINLGTIHFHLRHTQRPRNSTAGPPKPTPAMFGVL